MPSAKPVAVITGAAGAVGRATAQRFFSEGFRLVLTDINADDLGELTRQLGAGAGEVIAETADLGRSDAVDAAIGRAAGHHGRLDTLVYCAGIRPTGALEDARTEDDLQRCFDINVVGAYRCANAMLPHLKRSDRASIVIFSSAAGARVNAFMGAYCTSKAAIDGLVGVMAAEWSEYGIRINAIAPAQIESEMIAEQVGVERKRREERLPIGRYARPEEMAATALFLASSEASFITGSTLYADGGYTRFGFRPHVH